MRHSTVVHALETAARIGGDRLAFRFLRDGEQHVEDINFGHLYLRSAELANAIRQNAAPGDRAILFAETSIETIVALYACLIAGIVAVPVVPPHRNRIQTRAKHLLDILRDCSPKLVLAHGDLYDRREEFAAVGWQLLAPKWIRIDGLAAEADSPRLDVNMPCPTDIAFLQYTSGTTSRPSGVIVTHAALLANQRMIYEVTRAAHQDEWAVSWLPFFHDMGISFLFHAVLLQSTCTLLSPAHFVQSPGRWLRAASRYGSAFSATPNFALDLVTSKVRAQELEDIDLRSLKALIVGAEPVRATTLQRFIDKFGPLGFKADCVFPCFGLAESTLMATHPRRGGATVKSFCSDALAKRKAIELGPQIEQHLSRKAVRLVGNGAPGSDHSLLIVDPETHRALPSGEIGEIWLEGPSIGAGYWGNPARTGTSFEAEPETPNGKQYLRTGDLGFECDGELFVAGRLKDLIIVNGRNIYPADVEFIAEDVDERIVRGGVAAFEDLLEDVAGIAILAELNGRCPTDGSELAMRIRSCVMLEVEADVTYVGLLQARKLPRTTSGKLARAECRRKLEHSEFDVWSGWRSCANA